MTIQQIQNTPNLTLFSEFPESQVEFVACMKHDIVRTDKSNCFFFKIKKTVRYGKRELALFIVWESFTGLPFNMLGELSDKRPRCIFFCSVSSLSP
jgi:hypothetical protein